MSGVGTRGNNTNSTGIVPSTGRMLVVSENTKSASNISNIAPPLSPPPPSSSYYSDSSSSSKLTVNKDKKKCSSKIYDYNNCGYKLYENNIECFLEPIKKELIKRTYSRLNNKIGNTNSLTSTKVGLKNNNSKDDNNEEEEEEDLESLKDYLLDDFILNDIEFDMMHSIVREIENDELLNRSIWSPYSPSIDTNSLDCSESLLDDKNDEFIMIGNNDTNNIKDQNNMKSFPFTTTGRPSEQTGLKSKYTTFYRKQEIMEKEKVILNKLKVKVNLEGDNNLNTRSTAINDKNKKTKSKIKKKKKKKNKDHKTNYTLKTLNCVKSSETLVNVDCGSNSHLNTNFDNTNILVSSSYCASSIPSSSSPPLSLSVLPTNNNNNYKLMNKLLIKNNNTDSKELKRSNNDEIISNDCDLKRIKIEHSYGSTLEKKSLSVQLQNSEIIPTSSKTTTTTSRVVVANVSNDNTTSSAIDKEKGKKHQSILLANQPLTILSQLESVTTRQQPESIELFSDDSCSSSAESIKSSLTFYSTSSSLSTSSSPSSLSSFVSTSSTTFTSTSMDKELLGNNKFKYINNDSMSQSTIDTNNILSLKRNNDFFNTISNSYVLNNNHTSTSSGSKSFGVHRNRWKSELNQILLVHFDEHMLPLTYDYLTLNNNNNEMDINLLKRENTAIEIDRLRKKISIVTHKPIVFVYTYGFKSLNRAKQVLESKSCMYNISPFFKDINEFISFLNQMILF